MKSLKRIGCRDVWNAFMCIGATFGAFDIPACPTTARKIPTAIITWEEAKDIYKKKIALKEASFHVDSFVCWYIDDYKFDGIRGIWHDCRTALKILSCFEGVITPDFSTYQDFPEALKIYNTYRMRAFGCWLGVHGIAVVNNVRWGTPDTYRYCCEGIPVNSMVAIGTCGGSPRKLMDRKRFEEGIDQLIKVLNPHTIIVYGSANYLCFKRLKENGVKIVSYPSKTALAFERGKQHE